MKSNNPYLTIWFNPTRSIDNILTGKVKFNYSIPILLSVCSTFIGLIEDSKKTDIMSSIIIMIIGIVVGYFSLANVVPWLILQTGKIWKGKSGLPEMKIVVGLAQIPIAIILFEQVIFLLAGDTMSNWETNIALQWLVWIFSIRIMIIGIAKIQGFSYMIAFLNLIVCALPFYIIELLLI